ncbi:MAG TPA: hypothetical protein VHD84_02880 [Candidatus Saccharimonadales bacterium]|nr:hypothetical protein [Candidatus Saccharimonadales bacterium]
MSDTLKVFIIVAALAVVLVLAGYPGVAAAIGAVTVVIWLMRRA